MGCDIHVTVQKRVDGRWVDGQEWDEDRSYPSPKGGELFGERNYALFTILAGVRGEIDNPLAAGRGLPEEMSAEMRQFHEDNHSATHFTVAEVMAYDWQQELPRSGWVDPGEFARYVTNGHPESWSGGVGGGNIVHIDADRMRELIISTNPGRAHGGSKEYPFHDLRYHWDERVQAWLSAINALAGGSPYCHVSWLRPFWTQGGDLFASGLPRAWALGAPEDVRFVISFDN